MMPLDQIERAADRKLTQLIGRLKAGRISPAEYDREAAAILAWAKRQIQ